MSKEVDMVGAKELKGAVHTPRQEHGRFLRGSSVHCESAFILPTMSTSCGNPATEQDALMTSR
jgi:hypothetical protein